MEFSFSLEALGCISYTPHIWRGLHAVHTRSYDRLEARRSRNTRYTSTVQIGASYPDCKVPFQFHFHDVYRVVYCIVPVTQSNILEASKD